MILRTIFAFGLALIATVASLAQEAPKIAVPTAWLYIESNEVRQEVLLPVHAMESILPFARADAAMLTVVEQAAATVIVAAWFESQNPLSIDGIHVNPAEISASFIDANFSAIAGEETPRDRAVADTYIGIVARYEPKGAFSSVEITWTIFSETIEQARATIYSEKEKQTRTIAANAPKISWSGRGGNEPPAIETIPANIDRGFFAKKFSIEEKQARAIAEPLLRNIYRAFDYRNESRIYDALAESVDGELLATLYIQIRGSLALQSSGGPTTHVEEVVMTGGGLESSGDDSAPHFRYRAKWTVRGEIEHWGHVHSRLNEYKADLIVTAVDGAWKITGFQITDQERLETTTAPRTDGA